MVQARRFVLFAALLFVAFSGAQFPAFVQQYVQRLGGHLDEARYNARQVETADVYRGLEPEARAEVRRDAEARVTKLQAAVDAIGGASDVMRPVVVAWHVDAEIAAAAWRDFEPAVPASAGGFAYGGAAAGIGTALYWAVMGLVSRRRRRASVEPTKAP